MITVLDDKIVLRLKFNMLSEYKAIFQLVLDIPSSLLELRTQIFQ